jgi:hypothetical protein
METFNHYRLIAVDILSEANLTAVQALLAEGQAAERWAYEESVLAHGSQS